MKYKDYARLSKISLKARKKTTKSTVRGISFGMILLMPLLFILIAFHIDLNNEVDKDASIRVFNISYSDNQTDESYTNFALENYKGDIYNIDGIENVIEYNQYSFTNLAYSYGGYDSMISPFDVTLDNETFTLDEYVENTEVTSNYVGVNVIDTGVGNDIFLKADYEVLKGENPLVKGNTFSNNSKTEIMVSTNFINHYNLNLDNVVGKKISISYRLQSDGSITDSETEINYSAYDTYYGIPVAIIKEFEIVGVFDSNIYNTEIRNSTQLEYFDDYMKYETYFWITKDSTTDSLGNSYLPKGLRIKEESGGNTYYRNAYYYEDNPVNLAKKANNDNGAFIPIGFGVRTNTSSDFINTSSSLLEFESYKAANKAVGLIENIYKKSSTSKEAYVSSDFMQSTFENYRMFYNIFTYVCLILGVFGGIVFFATLLNLYNTIHYSVQSRRNYIGMLRAIGMKSKSVVALYFVEVFQIFKRSYIWTAIFGGGICAGLTLLFKFAMKSEYAQIITIDLSLNPIYILVTFVLLIIVNTIISIIFSLVACFSVSKKPILEVLVENR